MLQDILNILSKLNSEANQISLDTFDVYYTYDTILSKIFGKRFKKTIWIYRFTYDSAENTLILWDPMDNKEYSTMISEVVAPLFRNIEGLNVVIKEL